MTTGTDKRKTGHGGAIAARGQGCRGPRILAAATVALVPSAALAGPPPACSYTVTVIESPLMCGSQAEKTAAKAINANGLVAGERFCIADNRRPFLWSAEGGYQPLDGPPGAFDVSVEGLNIHGEIVGTAQFATAPISGYLRKTTGEYIILPTGPTGNWSEAYGLSDSSVVLGMWANVISGPSPVPSRWDGGILTDLTPWLDAPEGAAFAVNAFGQITGWTGTAAIFDARAFILDGDRAITLPPIPGGFTSEGYAINDFGDVVGKGRFSTTPVSWHAFAHFEGQPIDLGALPGTTKCSALDINNDRVVVGGSSSQAFVWQAGVMRDLNDLIPRQPIYVIKTAYSIDEHGMIASDGSLGSPAGPTRGFILTPVYSTSADLDGDCHVTGLDLGLLLGSWGAVKGRPDSSADLNNDGYVNGFDLALLLGEWG